MAKIKSPTHGSARDAITTQAASLFRQKGFAATSMRELALTIGVEAPSLYNHIGSKQELLQHICQRVALAFERNASIADNMPGSTVQKLEQFIRMHVLLMQQHFDEVFVANHEWKWLKEPELSNFLAKRKQYEKHFIQLIKEGIAASQFNNILPQAAMLIILSATRSVEYWHRYKAGIAAKELEENIVSLLLHGLIK